MDAKKLDATLEERTSKNGNKYQCIIIKLTDTYEKKVFLDAAELELVKTSQPTTRSPFGK
ncbi:MAG: hypothetical protein IJO43_02205 [Bacilli bacterium]|nr:hypothetical protein [Bacilli bacterium]